ncbi:MAG: metal-dependent transcriptional regulator [Bacteroidetes bacterium]|nr:metal-dependent transcriptional regulator [Bacteroidota bacterium]MBU1485756.1 metal-dependent transcriptional regulator [Bacteroidota bacterium]MBU2269617.1 metal-dependent transcriptional regulator [Bacteroidota bacterium]MBU2376303.1 metal-dependent transcriptional regulator [Bacteroidota bacterium]
MNLSFTEENYLKAIFHLNYPVNENVGTNAISEALNTRAASVTDMLKKLAEKELINYEKYQGVSLTDFGQKKAITIVRKHRLWEVFLVDKLNFKWDEVHDIAEELEHINSETLINRLEAFLDFPKRDPHGDPIPDKDGVIRSQELIPVSKLKVGDSGVISGVREHSADFLKYLEKTGLILGETLSIAEIVKFDSSVMVKIKKNQQMISREVAKNLLIAL